MKIRLSQRNIPLLATIGVFILMYIIGIIMFWSRGFLSPNVFINLLTDNAFVGTIAVGMTLVIITGGIDLSVGSVVAFVCVFTARLIEEYNMHPVVVILLALFFGAVLGFTMGCLIHFFTLPPFLVTLVGMFLCRGLAFQVSLESIPIRHPIITGLMTKARLPLGPMGNLPAIAIVFIIILIVGIYISQFTKIGRNTYAIGGSEQSAVLMGLPVGRTKIFIYTFCSVCAALGGVLYAIYTSSGYALACVGLELDVIASVVMGGTLLTGGVGFVGGTFVGVLILGLIQTFITFQGTLSSWWTKVMIGILLFVFILLQRYLSSRSNKKVQTTG